MTQLYIHDIIPNPQQPRTEFDADDLAGLAQSIKENGLISPVVVECPAEEGGKYKLIDGERRWRACKLLGMTAIDAWVTPPLNGTGERERLVLAMVSNIQRAAMNPVEEARAIRRMLDMGMSLDTVSERLGWTKSPVEARLRLLRFPPAVTAIFEKRWLKMDNVIIYELAKITNEADQIKIAQKLGERRAAAGEVRRIVALYLKGVEKQEVTYRKYKPQNGLAKDKKWLWLPEGNVPWQTLQQAGRDVCERCALADFAERGGCSDCPAVEIMRIAAGLK